MQFLRSWWSQVASLPTKLVETCVIRSLPQNLLTFFLEIERCWPVFGQKLRMDQMILRIAFK